jgi:zinc transport system ATP-binding protein
MSEVKSLEVENLQVRLKNKIVLENINLSLPENEFLGIIGPNGAGKTTFLKTIAGIIKPERGVIKIYNQALTSQKSLIGYVPQFNTFDINYPISVYDVVQMGLLGKSQKKNELSESESIVSTLDKAGLSDYANRRINELSGGELQRVLIARAIVNSPKILLLDEPTASIDTYHGRNFYDLLLELNSSITIILISHDIGAVSSHVKKIACLNKTLVFHDSHEITKEMLEKTYKCPVDLIAHGVPHRVFDKHEH